MENTIIELLDERVDVLTDALNALERNEKELFPENPLVILNKYIKANIEARNIAKEEIEDIEIHKEDELEFKAKVSGTDYDIYN